MPLYMLLVCCLLPAATAVMSAARNLEDPLLFDGTGSARAAFAHVAKADNDALKFVSAPAPAPPAPPAPALQPAAAHAHSSAGRMVFADGPLVWAERAHAMAAKALEESAARLKSVDASSSETAELDAISNASPQDAVASALPDENPRDTSPSAESENHGEPTALYVDSFSRDMGQGEAAPKIESPITEVLREDALPESSVAVDGTLIGTETKDQTALPALSAEPQVLHVVDNETIGEMSADWASSTVETDVDTSADLVADNGVQDDVNKTNASSLAEENQSDSSQKESGNSSSAIELVSNSTLLVELQTLRLSALKRRAAGAGASTSEIEAVDDAEDPVGAAIELVMNLSVGAAGREDGGTLESLRHPQVAAVTYTHADTTMMILMLVFFVLAGLLLCVVPAPHVPYLDDEVKFGQPAGSSHH